VHRHFPTKDALFEAVIADRLQSLTIAATELIDAPDAGAAFFTFFYRMADDARHNLAIAAALADTGEAIGEAGTSLAAALGVLLARAQHAGAVKADLQIADLHAIVAGVLVMEQRLPPASRGRGLAVVADGLRP
jgi:AcrR family transcriptional regulator